MVVSDVLFEELQPAVVDNNTTENKVVNEVNNFFLFIDKSPYMIINLYLYTIRMKKAFIVKNLPIIGLYLEAISDRIRNRVIIL